MNRTAQALRNAFDAPSVPYALGIFAPVLATALRFALASLLNDRVPFLLFFPAVLVTAYAGGLGPGLLATAASVALASYFFIEPVGALVFDDPRDIARLALFAGVCIAISAVCGRMRSAQRAAEANLREAETAKRLTLDLLASEAAAREDAERASRLKDEFLATVSHELRTPLNPIVGWTRLLREHVVGDTARHGLDVIERNTVALNRLIEDLLDVSRVVAGKLDLAVASVDIARVVHSAGDSVRLAADAKSIRLETDVAPGLGTLPGDPERLQQVLWNLLSNAVRFTPAHGTVRIEAHRDGCGAVEIVVSDTGQGIAPDFLPHVFERFRQADSSTKRQHGGLGLGLAIARHLVELHGGSIAADSEGEGKGARFTVRLPAPSELPGPASAPQTDEARPDELEGIHVLVVEDDADTRDLIAFVLGRRGAIVATAGSADEAVERLVATRPDVVVSDIGMPERDGYDLIRDIRSIDEGEGVGALAVTAYARVEERARVLEAGFDAHLAKPVDADELVSAVARLARRGARRHRRPS